MTSEYYYEQVAGAIILKPEADEKLDCGGKGKFDTN